MSLGNGTVIVKLISFTEAVVEMKIIRWLDPIYQKMVSLMQGQLTSETVVLILHKDSESW